MVIPIRAPSSGLVIRHAQSRLGGPCLLRVFISPLHDHSVVAPIAGTVIETASRRGGRIPAFLPFATRFNPFSRIVIRHDQGLIIRTTVFGGTFTNTLVSLVEKSQHLECLDPIVNIRYGSLMEIQGDFLLDRTCRLGASLKAGQEIGHWG